jgi:hypothetical protein
MHPMLRTLPRSLLLVGVVCLAPTAAVGQLIDVRTIPVASGDQFFLFPSARAGMGGVGIALDDSLGDPFVNPAKGAMVTSSQMFGSPMFYDISHGNGSARTLPLGALLHSPTWFGGGLIALQQIVSAQQGWYYPPCPADIYCAAATPTSQVIGPGQSLLSDRVRRNMYGFAFLGRTFGRTALAASVFWGGLNAMDGVDQLYPGSQSIDQYGHLVDYRVGLLRNLGGGRSLSLLGLHDRVTMTQDVTYTYYTLLPCPVPPDTLPSSCPTPRTRTDHNLDWTRTWGLHAQYEQPLTSTGWRIGGVLTGNYKTHPHIPDYALMNVPLDPGRSWAFELGPGIAHSSGPTTFGMDVLFQPIWSHTWASSVTNDTITTTDNHFTFSNVVMRLGVAQEVRPAQIQLGLAVRSIDYVMQQQVSTGPAAVAYAAQSATERRQHESWMEWTPTWGVSVALPGLSLRYVGRLTTGTGRPGVASGWPPIAGGVAVPLAGGDYVAAPSGPLTLQDATVITNQVSVVLPIK